MKIVTIAIAVSLGLLASQARAEILLEQLPAHYGGPGSDTSFINDSGFPVYEITADDFRFTETKVINAVRWWGFYGANFSGSTQPPVGDEIMRIRIHDDSGPDGLPGVVLYEETLVNPNRMLTGQIAFFSRNAPEYQYDVTLAMPFVTQPFAGYWMEMVQVGNINSLFRREHAPPPGDGSQFAVMNQIVGNQWVYSGAQSGLSFQLVGVPEPSSGFLLLVSGFHFITCKRRNRHV